MPCFEDIEEFVQATEYKDALEYIQNRMKGLLYTYRDRLTLLIAKLNFIESATMTTEEEMIANIKLGTEILNFAREFCNAHKNEVVVENYYNSQTLINDSYPFADRTDFRGKLRNALDSENAQIILVDGKTKSGMSHLEKFLQHIVSNSDILSFYPFNIPPILDEPISSLGETLASYMAIPLNLEIDFSTLPKDQFKFAKFFSKLKEKIRESDTVPIFFLHDFHKVQENNTSLLSFIQMLIEEVYRDFPKAIFILAGLKYTLIPRWINDLEHMLGDQIYEMEPVSVADIENCLRCIFQQYKEKIEQTAEGGNITEEQYLEEVLEYLLGEEQSVNLVHVGKEISRLLTSVKN